MRKLDLKKIDKNQIILPALIALTIVSYAFFTKYKPVYLQNNTQAVKGENTQKVELPRLLNSETISYNNSANLEQYTLQTLEEPEKVMEFYNTALQKRGWETETSGLSGSFLSNKYKKNGDFISITISKQQIEQGDGKEFTIVSISTEDN